MTIQKVTPQSLINSTAQVTPLVELTSLEKKDISKGKPPLLSGLALA
ncbi:hypothetical protein [Salmonella enterica]|nr:hypothetical protein [Salmonella enterica]